MKAWTRSWRLPIIPANISVDYGRFHSSTIEQYIETVRGAAQHHTPCGASQQHMLQRQQCKAYSAK